MRLRYAICSLCNEEVVLGDGTNSEDDWGRFKSHQDNCTGPKQLELGSSGKGSLSNLRTTTLSNNRVPRQAKTGTRS